MQSKAQFKSHPVHPMLVAFPVAFLYGAAIADVVGVIGNCRIVLARTEKGYAAFDDCCTHRGGSLADGVLACELVCCPWHGSQFNVRDGSVQSGPAEQSIGVYQVEEAGGEIQLIVPA